MKSTTAVRIAQQKADDALWALESWAVDFRNGTTRDSGEGIRLVRALHEAMNLYVSESNKSS